MVLLFAESPSEGAVNNEHMRNRILRELARLSPESYTRLVEQLEPVSLTRGGVIGAPRLRAESAHFIESGIVSLVASTSGGRSLEVAIVGDEGVAGITDALGEHPLPYTWVVQVPGLAYRVPTRVIREHILSCSELHELLMTYSQEVMHQLAQSAVCNRFHTSQQRLARWLLLTAERARTNQLELTHEYVAQMVGVPRSAVTMAAATFRAQNIIDYRRGIMTIRSVDRLRKKACECFTSVSADINEPLVETN
jgi:CRP-like cAMP-binding protein